MLPSALFTTFRQYKQDTQTITEWLASTARSCGYQPPIVSEKQDQTAKTKSKNKKKKKPAATNPESSSTQSQNAASSGQSKEYVVKTNEYVPMAETIVGSASNKVIIPLNIIRTWKSCITGRGATAKWYEINAKVEQVENISHDYFIEVLKKTLQLLVPVAKLQELDRNKFKLSSDKAVSVSNNVETENKFAHLEIQDIDEKAYDDLADAKGPTDSKPEKPIKFVAEGPDPFDEWYFALQCFMEDIQTLQEQAKSHWQEYADGETDLVTTAVSTNIAIEMVKRAEEEFLKLKRPDVIEAWGEVNLPMAWFGHCLARDGINARDVVDPRKYFVPMDAWEQAKESYLLLHRLVKVYSNGVMPGLEGPNRIFALTRPAYLGTYNPELEFEDISDKKQYEQMAALLNDMLVTIGGLTGMGETPSDDMLMIGISYLQANQVEPPMWLLFACQNFLDIHFTLQTRSERPYEELRDFAITTVRNLKQHQAFLRDNPLPRMRDRDDEDAVDDVLQEIDTWVLKDEVKRIMTSVQQQGTTKKRRIFEDFEVLRMSPLLCGMMKYNFHIQLQWKGITLVNDTGLVTAAHLYNALQANGYLGQDEPLVWDDTEYLLELHKAEDTFMGARPESIEDCTKRLALVQGVAPTTFARRRRGNNHRVLRSRNGSRFLKPSTPVAQILGVKFLMPHAPFDWHMEQLETFVGLAFDKDMKEYKEADAVMKGKIAHLDLSTEEGKTQLLHAYDLPPALGEGFCERNNLSMTSLRAFIVNMQLQQNIFDSEWKERAMKVLKEIAKEEKAKRVAAKPDDASDANDDVDNDDGIPAVKLAEDSLDIDETETAGQALEGIHDRWQHSKTLPLDIFIDIVHDSLQKEYLDIQFDYFAFFRSAFSLMQDIQEQVKPLLEPWLENGLVKERLREPEGAVCVVPQMTLLLACNPFEAPNIMALRDWLHVNTKPLRAAAKVMKPWIEENGDIYCATEEDREEKRTEDILKEGPKVRYFDSDDENDNAPVVKRKPEERKVGWSSALGMVDGLNAREMREVYDAMKDDDPMGPTVAETIARLKGTQLSDADRAAAEANRTAVKEMQESARQRLRERGDVSDHSDGVD